jgi:hypothetical protein
MFDFDDIHGASKDEQIRAYAVERAIEMGYTDTAESLIYRAGKIEEFIKNGSK